MFFSIQDNDILFWGFLFMNFSEIRILFLIGIRLNKNLVWNYRLYKIIEFYFLHQIPLRTVHPPVALIVLFTLLDPWSDFFVLVSNSRKTEEHLHLNDTSVDQLTSRWLTQRLAKYEEILHHQIPGIIIKSSRKILSFQKIKFY